MLSIIKDGVKVLYNNAEVGGFLVDNIKYENDLCVIKTIKVYPVGSKVYLTLDNNMVQEYENPDIKLPIQIELFANEGKSLLSKESFSEESVSNRFLSDFDVISSDFAFFLGI